MPNPRNKMIVGDPEDSISFKSLVQFVKKAKEDLYACGDADAGLRFEILHDYLIHEFRGNYLTYTSKALGL